MRLLKKLTTLSSANLLVACTTVSTSVSNASDNPQDYLQATSYINHSHPSIQSVIAQITDEGQTQREKAVALHDYVRDTVKFGFESEFYDMSASEVLTAGQGYCNTKSTLFIALLRGADIPARHRFYGLSSQVLSDVINPNSAYVDHSIVEVHLGGRWVRTDSFIADPALFQSATQSIPRPLGKGVRRDGSNTWDGINDSYSQFHPDYISREFGVYEDIGDFYANADSPYNKLNFVARMFFSGAIGSANNRIDRYRL